MENAVIKKYTVEIIDLISERYSAKPDLETVTQLSHELELSERSIIAKLSSLGIYKKKQYVTKAGTAPVRKEVYIDRIAMNLGIDVSLLECLEKVTKQALVAIDAKIIELVDSNRKPTLIKVD